MTLNVQCRGFKSSTVHHRSHDKFMTADNAAHGFINRLIVLLS